MMQRQRVIIMGAAGRDFHNFNMVFRDNPAYEVVAFTATQIPNIEGRRYPPALAGALYPEGIPIEPEEALERLIRQHRVDWVVFAYSDVSHEYVMHRASRALAAGASFQLLGPRATTLRSRKPVVAVTAVRTGSGKSQTTRRVAQLLRDWGHRVVIVRHPMPYGDLTAQAVQRFASLEDLDRYHCTLEEREEYEPHLQNGLVVYAGVDYARILQQAEAEADVIVWDGGNNDLPFFWPDVHIVVADPHRPGHELRYHPGEANVRMAHVAVINKVVTARPEAIQTVRQNLRALNPNLVLVEAASPFTVDDPQAIRGRRVVVVEDGPTLTHGEMAYGAGYLAAQRFGARGIVDPRPFAVGNLRAVYEQYPHIGPIVPAMGYSPEQIRDLEATLNQVEADVVIVATPVDLRRLLRVNKPLVRVRYELQEIGHPTLEDVLREHPALGATAHERAA
ncbi:MAG: GTPase [Chloroflexi bacterium]|nr:GTPase [Chloroflexota bacterium]